MNDAFSAWRTREGTALLLFYGALIAIVCGAFAYAGAPAHAYAALPYWVRLVPIGVPAACVGAALLLPAVRSKAYRLQLVSVGSFLAVLAAALPARQSDAAVPLIVLVIAMFGVQYAFLRWQELVAAYAAALVVFATLSAARGALLQPAIIHRMEILLVVAAVGVALGSLRLRSIYTAAEERFALERQTAELRRQMERNARMALTDALTGLLNRAGMNDLIDRALGLSAKTGTRTALLYLDLDGFKEINDVSGHDAGDLALVEAALRIQYLLRMGESAGRIGGDEFVIVLPSVQSADEARALAKRIDEAFTEPFVACAKTFTLSVSVGIAVSGEDGKTRLDLLRAADKAMYEMKRRRKCGRAAGLLGGSGI